MKYELNEQQIRLILEALERGDRVELIPTKDKIKVVRIRRQDITDN